MIGGLTDKGHFFVIRKEGKVVLDCPYQGKPCGTWCAQFSEPIVKKNERRNDRDVHVSGEHHLIHICQGRYWKLTKFHDERPDQLANDVMQLGY